MSDANLPPGVKLPPDENRPLDEDLLSDGQLPSDMKLVLWSLVFVVLLACTTVVWSQHNFKQSQAYAALPASTPPLTSEVASAPSPPSANATPPLPPPPLASAEATASAVHPSVVSPAPEQLVALSPLGLTGLGKLTHKNKGAIRSAGDTCPIALWAIIRPGCNTFFHTEVRVH
jgi:hypothetical protein